MFESERATNASDALEQERYHGRQSILQLIGESALFADAFRRSQPGIELGPDKDLLDELHVDLFAGCTPEETEQVRAYFDAWALRIRASSEIQAHEARRHGSLRDAGRFLVEAQHRRDCFLQAGQRSAEGANLESRSAMIEELFQDDDPQ
jgi:hypothetical protein